MTRYLYARCICGCREWLVLDSIEHTVVGYGDDATSASRAADRLNRELAVYWSPEEPLKVRWPRTIAAGLMLGMGAYVAVVAVLAVAR